MLPSSGTDTLDYSKHDADTETEEEESITLTDPIGYSMKAIVKWLYMHVKITLNQSEVSFKTNTKAHSRTSKELYATLHSKL